MFAISLWITSILAIKNFYNQLDFFPKKGSSFWVFWLGLFCFSVHQGVFEKFLLRWDFERRSLRFLGFRGLLSFRIQAEEFKHRELVIFNLELVDLEISQFSFELEFLYIKLIFELVQGRKIVKKVEGGFGDHLELLIGAVDLSV